MSGSEDTSVVGKVTVYEIPESQKDRLSQPMPLVLGAEETPAPKTKKTRKPRVTSKFIVIPADMLKIEDAMPSLIAARKRAQSLGANGTFYIACLREEVTVETIVPEPVTKVAVKRVAR